MSATDETGPYRPEQTETLATPEEIAAETMVAVAAPFATPEKLERARELVRTLAVAHTNAALYPMTHPLVASRSPTSSPRWPASCELGFEEVTVNIYKGTLFVENQVFPEESVTYRKLIEELLARGISAVTLHRRPRPPQDAAAFVELLADPRVIDIDAAQSFLEARSVRSVQRLRDDHARETRATRSASDEVRARPARATTPASAAMRDVETQAKLGKVFEVEPLQRLSSSRCSTTCSRTPPPSSV